MIHVSRRTGAGAQGGFRRKETFSFETEAAVVNTFSQGAFVQLNGEYLVVKHLPQCFKQRYGRIPERIYVRESYRRLYEMVADSMLRGSMEFGVTLFTGVPGIGKSLFLVYFINRFLLDDRFTDKRFALEFDRGAYECFQPTTATGEFWCSQQDGHYLPSKDFLLLCDISDAAEPVSRAKWTLIFSSPAPARYKEILKNAPNFKFTMPTWSELELLFVNGDIASWYDDFVLFGGVPRHVVPNPNDLTINSHSQLRAAVAEKGGPIAEAFFKFSFGTVDWLQSYLLVHINPPVSVHGDFQYDGDLVYSFASDAIFQRLVDKHNTQMLAGAVGLFNAGAASETYGAVSAGNLFEKICLWLKPLNGQNINAAALEAGGAVVHFSVPVGRYELPHNWKSTGQLPLNVLILPRISNLESGDSFYVVQIDPDNYLLVVFQITVGKAHPVKANGLHDILLAFSENVRNKITHKALVFVIPKHGTLDKEQKLHTQKDGEIVVLPLIVRGFQQYLYRHEI